MITLVASCMHIPIISPHPSSRLECALVSPSLTFGCNPKRRDNESTRRCLRSAEVIGAWENQSDGDVGLQSEIMDFMEKSEKPTMFPRKEELINAGRMDLVEAIKKTGGWYSLGWDDENELYNFEEAIDVEIEDFLRRVQNSEESCSEYETKNGFSSKVKSNSGNLDLLQGTSTPAALDIRTLPNIETETWRSWSNKRAGARYEDFEAAEISYSRNKVESDGENDDDDGMSVSPEGCGADRDDYEHQVVDYSQMKNRLKHLESELTSTLHSLRSKRVEWISKQVANIVLYSCLLPSTFVLNRDVTEHCSRTS